MEDNRGQRRQNEPPIHGAPNPRYHQSLHDSTQQRRSFAGAQGDRYRAAPLTSSPSGAARGMSGSAGYSGYYQEPSAAGFPTTAMPQGAMSYHHGPSDYGQPDTRQTQGFASTYNPNALMYNVPQGAGPQSTAVYDTSQQFPQRQPATLQMMATDVTAPYFSSEPTNTAAATALQAQTGPSSAQVYGQSSMPGYSSGGMTGMGGMNAQATSTSDVRMEDDYPAGGTLDHAYASYQTALKEIFQNIQNGVLATASDSLIRVSDWLLSHVADLGLTSDDQSLHGDRIKLWNDFNHAWLGMLQRQKEMTESGQQPQRSQSVISAEGLKKMGKELIRLCDSIERHGLVDYQYGVWEEQIIEILTECLNVYEPTESSGDDSVAPDSQRR
ncbi:hypothetical protein NEUTE1DRAFT_76809 [Neurospora tetrasperma FGSC 2508]|uniref:Uncharacterized protein n=1 Tax=Neurospora tetrasperma (strain FGSC 2508 / ATCC MYA-4615 / P0657) TaxID=510951 RepID=F8MBC6_NEUT8|nr:uncharacterized protein NEUTE1DRAFT_76809 [Neurospora tetrasperma FGSC 2508]EGO61091.1 hypothetical protein NEUTE1DRAFT_76809 [Neurospora tetrasperma FGSC 2508]EGZ74903.1 hypothetical protein NEUTE2DRAFT_155477 [Neurospora tetrasperma FGSC 2509]